MTHHPSGLARTLTRAPLRSVLLVVGACLACASVALLAALVLAPPAHRVLSAGPSALRVVAHPAAVGAQPGLTARDAARLRAALPGAEVGAARALAVVELAPPLLPIDALSVIAAEPAWLSLQGIATTTGRELSSQDAATAAQVCLVSPRIARALAGDASPVGHHLRVDGAWLTVVGVLGTATAGLQLPDLVLPLEAGLERMVLAERPGVDELLVERTAGAGLESLVARVLEGEHDGMVGWDLEGHGGDSDARPSALAALLGLLAALALAGLAVAGQALERLLEPTALPRSRAAWQAAVLCLAASSPGLVVAWLLAARFTGLVDLSGALPPAALGLGLLPPVLLGLLMGLLRPRAPAL